MSSQISFFFFFSFFILLVIVVSAKWARRLKLLAWNGVSAKSRIQQKLTYKFKKQKKKKRRRRRGRRRGRERERESNKKIFLPKIIVNQPWNPYLLCGRAPICCAQAKFFSKLNSIKRKEVDIYIYIYTHTLDLSHALCACNNALFYLFIFLV